MNKAQIGDVRAVEATPYDRPGEWAVEEFAYTNSGDEPTWAIPGWVEDRFGETGFFKTKFEALSFIDIATT